MLFIMLQHDSASTIQGRLSDNSIYLFILNNYFLIINHRQLNQFQLEKRGYTNIDALEPASEMLKLAAEKGVYRSLYCDVLGGSEVTIPDGKDCFGLMMVLVVN